MSYRFLVDAQKAHIITLRCVIAILTGICGYLAWCWQNAPTDLTIHVPRDLRAGSVRKWWDIPPENVYAFGLYIFTTLNRWEKDGEIDMPRNIRQLQYLITPACRQQLERETNERKQNGELANRERMVSEIIGYGYADNPEFRVKSIGQDAWRVTLDISATENFRTKDTIEEVKKVLVRYPVRIIRSDVNPEMNPWGLMFDCYTETPKRIEIEEEKKEE